MGACRLEAEVGDYAQGPIMADEVMVRILKAQAEAVWPQEEPLLRRYPVPDGGVILDVASGTGEISARLARAFPQANVLGIDLVASHLAEARRAAGAADGCARFARGDAYRLPLPDGSVDLALCRHLLQAIEDPGQVVAELHRVLRPAGTVHLVAEDYGQIRFHPTRLDTDAFWRLGPMTACERTGSDLRQGRKALSLLAEHGFTRLAVDYIHVDTLRVPRPVFVRIWEAWAEGYAAFIAEHSSLSRAEVDDHWRDMIDCLHDPKGYACWSIPAVSGTVG